MTRNENPNYVSCLAPHASTSYKQLMPSEKNRSRTSASTPQKKASPSGQHSPFAGCSIIGIAGFIMLFLVGFTLYSLNKITDAMKSFTQEEQVSPPTLDLTQHVSTFNDLSRRLDGFEASVLANEHATLSLTPLDINLAIATHDPFKELRKTFFIKEITEETLSIQISYPINGKPLSKEEHRYLNGTLHGVPELQGGQLLLQMEKIDSLKGDVPEQFVAHLSDHQITAPYLEDPELGPIMKKLTSVSLTNGALVLTVDPRQEPPGRKPLTPAEETKTKIAAIASLVGIIALVGTFLFFFLNRKERS